MDVESAASRHVQQALAQDLAVRRDDQDVWLERTDQRHGLRVADPLWLHDVETVRQRQAFHGRRRRCMTAARGPVRLGDNRNDFMLACQEGVQAGEGEGGGAEEGEAHAPILAAASYCQVTDT